MTGQHDDDEVLGGDGRWDLDRLPYEVRHQVEEVEGFLLEQITPGLVGHRDELPDRLRVTDGDGNYVCSVPVGYLGDVDVRMLVDHLASAPDPMGCASQAAARVRELGREGFVAAPDSDMVRVDVAPHRYVQVHRSVCVPGWPPDDTRSIIVR